MRAFDCVAPDGTHAEPAHFEAEDDDGIVAQAKGHVSEYHAALGLGEDQLRQMVRDGAYDVEARGA